MIDEQPGRAASPRSRFGRSRLIPILAGAGLLAIGAVICYERYWLSRPIGTGPAGPPVNQELFSQQWTFRPALLIGLGDSVTAGFGARTGYGYFDRLLATPQDEWGEMKRNCLSVVLPNLRATNLAVSGSTSLELAESQLPRLPEIATNTFGLIVITTGGNDLIHNYGRTPPREQAMYGATFEQAMPWIEHFEQRLERIIGEVTNRFPGGCHIFLANIYDPTDGSGDIDRAGLPAWPEGAKLLAAYNDTIACCAARHPQVHAIDLHGAFLGHGIHCTQFWSKHYDSKDPHYWYYQNLEDPNERGYDVIRRLFLIEIAKVANQLK